MLRAKTVFQCKLIKPKCACDPREYVEPGCETRFIKAKKDSCGKAALLLFLYHCLQHMIPREGRATEGCGC